MSSNIINIIILLILGFAAFLMLRKILGHKKLKLSPADLASQKLYNQQKQKNKEETINLTLQEKIELSWQFLTSITEQIMDRFSKKDQQLVYKAGRKLAKNGATYQHNVEQEAAITMDVIKARVLQKNKTKAR